MKLQINKNLLQDDSISFDKQEGYITVTNPANGDEIAYIKQTNQQELEKIIELSHVAQKQWADMLVIERSNILLKWYDLILANKDDLAVILTSEMGKPLEEAKGEVVYAANFIRWFAEEARRIDGDILQSTQHNQKLMVLKQPIGVCGAITPWNFPAAMITRKVGPALACGCSMIVKPATQTPLTAYALLNLARKAGVPQYVMDVVSGISQIISKTMCQSDIVRKISFTGSTEVGRKLMEQGASTIKKMSLELGGNAPVIVFEDADIDKATDGILASKFRNSGQTCVCANRIFVHEKIYDEVAKLLKEKVEKLKVGDGLEPGTTQGPLIDGKAVEKVKEHISDAISKGAKILTGGDQHELGLNFFQPTILTDVTNDMIVSREETFGPLAPLFKFSTKEEVIEKANDTEYGLASYVYTNNLKNIWDVSEKLEYGMVGINTGIISNEVSPFGGVKQSGLGREGSKYGMDDYLELKYLCINL